MALKEVDEKLVHLLRELLLHKMASFGDVDDLQIRDELLHRAAPDVVLHARKPENVVFFSHDQQRRDFDFRIGWACYLEQRPTEKQTGCVNTV